MKMGNNSKAECHIPHSKFYFNTWGCKERPVYYAALDFTQFIYSNHLNILRYSN